MSNFLPNKFCAVKKNYIYIYIYIYKIRKGRSTTGLKCLAVFNTFADNSQKKQTKLVNITINLLTFLKQAQK